MAKQKRNYKDSLFVDLFGRCKDAKENFLSLYNVIHGTNLKVESTTITPITLKHTIYTGKYNDVAMIINGSLVMLVEQQSTINENMPLRFLGYISKIYDKIVKSDDKYKRKLLPLPKPEFYVIYNGTAETKACETLYLSDAFMDFSSKFDYNKVTLELLVKVYNINKKQDNAFLLKCIPLAGYAHFVEVVNRNRENGMEDPIGAAIKQCIDENILAEYLTENSTEVHNMTFGEYDYETDVRVQRQEAKEEGIEEGLAKGIEQGIEQGIEKGIAQANIAMAVKMIERGKLSFEEISEDTGLPLKKVEELALKN